MRERIGRTAVAEYDRCHARRRHGREGQGQRCDFLLPCALAGADQTFPIALGGAAGAAQGDEGVAFGWLVARVEDGGPEGCGGAGGVAAGDDVDCRRGRGGGTDWLGQQRLTHEECEAGGEKNYLSMVAYGHVDTTGMVRGAFVAACRARVHTRSYASSFSLSSR